MSITLTIERVTDYSHVLAALEVNGLPKSIIHLLVMFYFRKWFSSQVDTDATLEHIFNNVDVLKPIIMEEVIIHQESFPPYLVNDRGLTSMAKALVEIHSFYGKTVKSLRQAYQYAFVAKYGYQPHFAVVNLDVRLSGWYLNIN